MNISTHLSRIIDLLEHNDASYRLIADHAPTYTSEESARVRGESIQIGGKALVLKTDDHFGIYVMRACDKLDSKLLKKTNGYKKIRFATPDELAELTGGLVPGSVPPFGQPIIDLPLTVDEQIMTNGNIAFNAGSLTDSIVLAMDDYVRIAQPTWDVFVSV